MENLSKNIAPSVFISSGEFALIQIIKATEGAPLFNIMGIRGHYNVGEDHPNYKHGLSHTPLHWLWGGIKDRLFNNAHQEYSSYGGRGISMHKPWIHNAKLFCDYVASLPYFGEKGYSLDRIDNDGHYEPGNLRWTTRHIQNTNQNLKKNNTTGFVGVYYQAERSFPWLARIGINNKYVRIGRFKTKLEAAIARNNYIIANNLTEYRLNEIK